MTRALDMRPNFLSLRFFAETLVIMVPAVCAVEVARPMASHAGVAAQSLLDATILCFVAGH